MIRSGSTLQYQISSELIEHFGLGRRSEFVPPARHPAALAGSPAGLSTFKTHKLTEPVAGHCRNGAAALYIFRDLRDVIGSLQQKEARRIEGEALAARVRDLLETDRAWRALPSVYISRYEDVLPALLGEVMGIAGFLGIACPGEWAAQLAAALSYGQQQQAIAAADPGELVEATPANVYHRRTLLHRNHFQGGAVGRYRVDLDSAQRSLIEQLAGAWLTANGYSL